ncbi:MAG: hypothetical protein ACRC20_16840 [Segniliparus sp.]|uniref:hypothetical protein n=1 Tax=Segniliparus sp. TaxID=2804064 RepID=UPI003F2D3C9C
MGIAKSKFQSLDLSALAELAEQLDKAAQVAEEQAAAQSKAPDELSQHFRGGASASAADSLRRKAGLLQSNATALAQLSEAVSDVYTGLSASRDAVGELLRAAQAQGFQVDEHWRVTDISGNQGLAREAAWRSLSEQLRAALGGYDSADQGAVRRIREAVESFAVPQLDAPQGASAEA